MSEEEEEERRQQQQQQQASVPRGYAYEPAEPHAEGEAPAAGRRSRAVVSRPGISPCQAMLPCCPWLLTAWGLECGPARKIMHPIQNLDQA